MTTSCTGTRVHPGCGANFEATDGRKRFCPECSKLDRASSFVFVERRRALIALAEEDD